MQYSVVGAEAVVLARIKAETGRAITKHGAGTMGVDLFRDLAKIMEELGEASEASLNMDVYDRTTPDSPNKPAGMAVRQLHFEDELVQVVSLSIRLLVTLQKIKEVGHE